MAEPENIPEIQKALTNPDLAPEEKKKLRSKLKKLLKKIIRKTSRVRPVQVLKAQRPMQALKPLRQGRTLRFKKGQGGYV